jgi:4-amino-4-deoxy-L-arabinose transferase-like glycosyltransferase
MYRLLLAVPFLVGIAVLQGLTVEIETFHGSDAGTYQLPTIDQFRERLDFSDYPSAQTPLFHLVETAWGKLVGFELWKLRLLNVAISYAAVLALLRLLRRATALGELPAFALTLAFALSPYFLGASFTLLTDNLAILFALLALERVHRYTQDGSLTAFALACLATGAAVLTRQSFLWLVPVAAFFLIWRRPPARELVAGGALLALALVPLAALVVEWNGLVPPSADPASCGLCTDRPGFGRDALTLRTVGFTVALVGLYAALAFGPSAWRRLRALRSPAGRVARKALGSPAGQVVVAAVRGGAPARPGTRVLLAAAAAAALVLLLVSPLEYVPVRPAEPGDAGYLWRVSDWFPSVLGSSLLFWVLVPLGAGAAGLLARRAGWSSLPTVYLAAFLLAALPVHLVYQKYFDPFALLAIALFARPVDFRDRADYAGIALICAGSVAYALSFAG